MISLFFKYLKRHMGSMSGVEQEWDVLKTFPNLLTRRCDLLVMSQRPELVASVLHVLVEAVRGCAV